MQYNLEVGDVFEVLQEGEQNIVQSFPESDHVLYNRMTTSMTLKVVAVSENFFDLQTRFKELSMEIGSEMAGVLLDINTAASPDALEDDDRLFAKLLDIPIRIRMSRTGEILEVGGGEELVRRLIASADLDDAFSEALLRTTLERDFGSQALLEGFRQLTFFYPTNRVKVGDHWQNRYTGRVQAENEWTLSSLSAASAAITGRSRVRLNLNGEYQEEFLEGTQETRIEAFRQSGFARQMLIRTQAEGRTNFEEEKIPTTITATIKYTLTHVQ